MRTVARSFVFTPRVMPMMNEWNTQPNSNMLAATCSHVQQFVVSMEFKAQGNHHDHQM
jgi:hypothetical protein